MSPSTYKSQPVCLAVGGSDPSGGAGVQADLKTFHHHGTYGAAALSLLTVQNTLGVRESRVQDPEFVAAQVECVLSDFPVAAVKTGALGNGAVAAALALALSDWKGFLVVDTVMLPKNGSALADLSDLNGFRLLWSRADLLTPNLDEASFLLDRSIDSVSGMESAALELKETLGPGAVLLKGGHLPGAECIDVLLDGQGIHRFPSPRLQGLHTHGTGCALASCVAAFVAHGKPLREAVQEAKAWVARAIETAPGLGHGNGPLNLWA